jgi:hypothetical protein
MSNKLESNMQAGTTQQSSTGGTITYTRTGLIHKSGGTYSGKLAAQEAAKSPKD